MAVGSLTGRSEGRSGPSEPPPFRAPGAAGSARATLLAGTYGSRFSQDPRLCRHIWAADPPQKTLLSPRRPLTPGSERPSWSRRPPSVPVSDPPGSRRQRRLFPALEQLLSSVGNSGAAACRSHVTPQWRWGGAPCFHTLLNLVGPRSAPSSVRFPGRSSGVTLIKRPRHRRQPEPDGDAVYLGLDRRFWRVTTARSSSPPTADTWAVSCR